MCSGEPLLSNSLALCAIVTVDTADRHAGFPSLATALSIVGW